MERILVAFGFVLVLEAIVAKLALILLFGFMVPAGWLCQCPGEREGRGGPGGLSIGIALLQLLQCPKLFWFFRTAFADVGVCVDVRCVGMFARGCAVTEEFPGRGSLGFDVGYGLLDRSSERNLGTRVHGYCRYIG